jgi:predicted CXXCH cytochrome family protein
MCKFHDSRFQRFRSHFALLPILWVVGVGGWTSVRADAAEGSHPKLHFQEESFRVEGESESRPLGSLSAYCLECHGPDLGAMAPGSEAPTPTHAVSGSGRSHPVDVPYPISEIGLVPGGDLDQRLSLVDGQMTCITCHDSEAADRALVLPKEGSQLCLACHRR